MSRSSITRSSIPESKQVSPKAKRVSPTTKPKLTDRFKTLLTNKDNYEFKGQILTELELKTNPITVFPVSDNKLGIISQDKSLAIIDAKTGDLIKRISLEDYFNIFKEVNSKTWTKKDILSIDYYGHNDNKIFFALIGDFGVKYKNGKWFELIVFDINLMDIIFIKNITIRGEEHPVLGKWINGSMIAFGRDFEYYIGNTNTNQSVLVGYTAGGGIQSVRSIRHFEEENKERTIKSKYIEKIIVFHKNGYVDVYDSDIDWDSGKIDVYDRYKIKDMKVLKEEFNGTKYDAPDFEDASAVAGHFVLYTKSNNLNVLGRLGINMQAEGNSLKYHILKLRSSNDEIVVSFGDVENEDFYLDIFDPINNRKTETSIKLDKEINANKKSVVNVLGMLSNNIIAIMIDYTILIVDFNRSRVEFVVELNEGIALPFVLDGKLCIVGNNKIEILY